MKKDCKKLFCIITIAVLLISQAGATQPLEAETVLAEATTELGVPYSEIPEGLSAELLDASGCIARRRDLEEDTNTAIFENADGTQTLYLFAEDIWYTDENGMKTDYTSALRDDTAHEATAFVADGGSGTLVLPEDLRDSVTYEKGGITIEMVPSNDTVVSSPITYPAAEAIPPDPDVNMIFNPETGELEQAVAEPAAAAAPEDPSAEGDVSAAEEECSADTETAVNDIAGQAGPVTSDIAASGSTDTTAADAPVADTAPDAGAANAEAGNPAENNTAADGAAAAADAAAGASIAQEYAMSEYTALAYSNERAYSDMTENTIQPATAEKNLLEQAADFLGGANRAKKASFVSEGSGQALEKVQYARAFDSKTAFSCIPQRHGFVNEITLDGYTGQNQFSFRVSLDGGSLLNSTGYSVPIADEQGDTQGHIVLRELIDAAGNTSTDNLIDVAQYEDGDYLVTITLDEEFLQDPGTQYPVALSTSTKTLTASYINDTHVTSTSPNTNYASAALMKSGDAGSDSLNYIFIQFIFSNTSWYQSIAPNGVNSASLNLYSNNSGSAGRISCSIPTGTWNYQNITWNNRPGMNSNGSFNGVSAVGSSIHANAGWQTIYITDFIKASLRNYVDDSLPQTIHELRGLRLWVNRPQFRQYRSTNYGSDDYTPFVTINYTPSSGGTTNPYGLARSYANWNFPSGDPNLSNLNCIGYALYRIENIKPIFYTENANPISESLAEAKMVDYIRKNHANISKISGQNASINTSTQYRIAFRINRYPVSGIGSTGYGIIDYHFIVQTASGGWAQKNNTQPSQDLGFINPDSAMLAWRDLSSTCTTLYYAVTP